MNKFFTFVLALATFNVFAQAPTTCSIDPVFLAMNNAGIWPDSATNFIQGTVGQPYGQNITVRVPKDTTQNSIVICFNRVELSTPATYTNFALPPGLNLLAGPTVTAAAGIYKYPGNATSCSVISGTPTTAGTYTIQFKVQPYLTPSPFGPCPSTPNYNNGSASISPPTTLNYYIIKINPSVGIKEEVSAKSLNVINVPNPFSEKTTIKFNVKDEAIAKICVYNLLGDKIFEDKITTKYGDNNYELDGSNWSSGMYLYTIQYKNYSETKRMVLTGNR
ncbi:MAG: T9SS type A sorting domain-containing protein [Bacteroidota bacterium]|nr:T9SS type A sorting domain-containing protein [Bacteroidota bacterium]MDP3145299.1 T9SS type A sorting domain-containing protein [Bacteroidota bacterium]